MTAPFQVCGPLDDDTLDALRESIRTHGLLVPPTYTHDGRIVDGHHRVALAESLGVKFDREVLSERSDEEYLALAITLNADRRQLTREQRRELVAKAIKAQPEKSDRQIAQQTGVSDKTVGAVRTDLEATAEIPQLEARTGADGKTRKLPTPTPAAEHECTVCHERFPHAVYHCGNCDQHWNVKQSRVCPECNDTTGTVDLRTGELLDEPGPTTTHVSNPIADAVNEAKNSPSVVAHKAMKRLVHATETVAVAGGAAAILADMTDPDADDLGQLWLGFIDDAFAAFEPLRAGLRRRNLRSVK